MDLLEMPLDAIVFRIHSLPPAAAAGSLWACLAVLAAALGLWRFRAVGSRSDSSLPPPSTPPPKPAPTQAPASVPAPKSLELTAPAPHCSVEDACTPKSRFMAYYDPCERFDVGDDGDDEAEVDNGRKDDRVRDVVRARSTAPVEGFGWEGLVIRRRGDLGWYRFQDLTSLNGNVVRLWDGDGVATATPWRRSPMSCRGMTGI